MSKKNLRRISLLVTAQTAGNINKLADMEQTDPGRVVDKLVRDRMISLHNWYSPAEKIRRRGH